MEEREIEWIIKEKYGGRRDERIKEDIKRLLQGEPVDYIIGYVNFINSKIDLSLKPLIPREETEFWGLKLIEDIGDKKVSCLDLFSGSGCLGVSVLRNNKNAFVDFGEIDSELLKQIEINLREIDKKRYNLIETDIFSNIDKKYDYIFANPPYIPEKKKLHKSVLHFEPKKALFGGEDGLYYISIFLKEVKKYLKKGGKAYMEFDSFQKKKIDYPVRFYKDQYNKWRYLVIENK